MRILHYFFWSVFLLAAGTAVSWARPGSPAPVQGDVTISFSIPESTVSLHEPVYVVFTIHNGLNEGVRFDLGYDGKHNFEFTIIEPNGTGIRTPPTKMAGEVMGRFADRAPLAPGKTFTKKMLLNQWYEFAAPGNYLVEAKLGGRVQTVRGAPVSPPPRQEIPLRITARDPERLKGVCEELTKNAMGENAEEASSAAFALSYVNDPVVVPYLGRILREGSVGKDRAIAGLVRIGNAEAVGVLISESEAQDPETRIEIDNALKQIQSRTRK